jgi:hypothetical protein
MKPSSARVLALLRERPAGITPRDALEIGCMRLAARVNDLRADGLDIEAELVVLRSGPRLVRVARYRLIEREQLALAL